MENIKRYPVYTRQRNELVKKHEAKNGGSIIFRSLVALGLLLPISNTFNDESSNNVTPKIEEINSENVPKPNKILKENRKEAKVATGTLMIEREGGKILLLDYPKKPSLEDKKLLNFFFKTPDMKVISKGKKSPNSSVEKDQIIDNETDRFFAVWNVYREGNNSYNFDVDYKKLKDILKVELEKKSKNINHKKIAKFKLGLNDIAATKNLKQIQEAERLFIFLSIINRNLSASYPPDTFANVVKHRQYSWTHENKFPINSKSKKNKEPELISFQSIKAINELYTDFIDKQTNEDAKSLMSQQISNLLQIKIPELPTNAKHYQTIDLTNSKQGISLNTNARVEYSLDLFLGGEAVIVGSHMFYYVKEGNES